MSDDIEIRVIASLNEPEYDWRTVSGIARENSLNKDVVEHAIFKLQMKGVVVESSNLDDNGHEIFTTKKKYMRKGNFANRILTALSDKVK
ncbi:hypothetical protein SAMN04488587_1529 [Methanococcoides vulcani]|uniref:Uncharacterized protein n=2 Tax=Methanococcoides vulcani TaxID=1353158 RepID=A0A1I0AAD4_9EURY|nr:hypothetical protein SAMN04488587_1529 [Methanococcoides vulcani]